MEIKNSVKTILIDDDLKGRKTIEEYLSKIKELELSEIFDSTQAAYNFILKNAVELIVFNSDIKEQNSADFLKRINENIAVVYLHSNRDTESENIEQSPINYVFKTTLNLPKFKKAIEKANTYIKATNPSDLIPVTHSFDKNYFLIKETLVMYKLKYNEVSYISALENYIKIHAQPKTYMVLTTLRQFEQSIDNHPFVRVHRSFIINLDFIYTIAKDVITLSDGTQIPIGEQYKKVLESLFIKGKIIKR
jgi:two-component system, LytTR family, response regulator